jgi:hypothetical protein
MLYESNGAIVKSKFQASVTFTPLWPQSKPEDSSVLSNKDTYKISKIY